MSLWSANKAAATPDPVGTARASMRKLVAAFGLATKGLRCVGRTIE
jgi:hypothetical protein